MKPGVSVVIPVHNGERWLDRVLAAALAEDDGRPFEVVVVDDHSRDRSAALLEVWAQDPRVRVLDGPGRGAAAAINRGIRDAGHPFIAQIDQDVELEPGWLARLLSALGDDERIGGAQGYYELDRIAPLWARVAALDLELRYGAISGDLVDHICTGNSVYRAAALREVGLFDESLGYGYDNDISYRLGEAGYRLTFCRDARSIHHWRRGLGAYLRQQYGLGYGRLDLIAKHPRRFRGDQVSGLAMILHVPGTLAALAGLIAAAALGAGGGPWQGVLIAAVAVLAVIAGERLVAGLKAAVRFHDLAAGLAMAPAHLLRNCIWVLATLVWAWRRLGGRLSRPEHSMLRR